MSSQLIWAFVILQVATVVAIFLFLRMFFYGQLEIGMKKIKRLDQENLKKESHLNERLAELDREWNARIAEAEREATRILDEAKEEVKRMRDGESVKAREESKRIIATAHQEREKVLKEAQHEIYDKAIDFSKKILERIFSEQDLKSLREKVSRDVAGFLVSSKEVEELLADNKEAEVVTADALTEENKKYILKIIKDKVKGKIDVKFSVERNGLGGLVLKIGKRIIDGSVAYRVNKAAQDLREELR